MVKAEREGGGAATGGAAEVFATGITAGGCIEAFAAGITAGGCIEVFATGIAAGGCIEVFAPGIAAGGCIEVFATGITAGGCLGVTAAGCFGVTGGAEAVATCVTAGCFAGGGVMCKALGVTICFVATGRSAGACFRGGGVMCKTPGPEALGSTVWGGGASLDRGAMLFLLALTSKSPTWESVQLHQRTTHHPDQFPRVAPGQTWGKRDGIKFLP